MKQISIAIMAGGQSRRMGRNKAFVPLKGKLLIEHVLTRVQALEPAQILIVANDRDAYTRFGIPVYRDVLPGKGALGGIYSALHYSTQSWVLVVACDMPFLNTALLEHLCEIGLQSASSCDAVVPIYHERPQGMHAVYSRACLEPIRKNLDAGQLRIISFYDQVRVRYVRPDELSQFDPEGLSFRNINTPEDLTAAQQLVQDQ